MAKQAAVLFDLDGTLLDTAPDLGAAANYVLAQHQQAPLTLEQARQLSSHGAIGLLKAGFGETWELAQQTQLRQQLLDYYQQHICQGTDFFPGVRQALQWLNQQDIPWGVVTNKPEYLSKLLLAHFIEFEQSGVLIGGDTLVQRKPDPAPMLLACNKLAVQPQHCLYVGDAERDIEAGRNSHMTTMLAGWGYLSENDRPELWQADIECPKSELLTQSIQAWLSEL
ncbi:HAD family hydrolase [Agarivorans gilvus]|jgi:phosphoglycolate phosphatase|uniref:Phosphoglycolate phosphatase n=1 Tax=Agarivorans gilvus TaxID=680279 RepID=A0ABQ1HY50_9ALTE|nr:HAD-IA family hydrolase [Agarivorans gilvus]GGA98390.1 phosphoglycolate phosphatase [Agarivorans gilvus]